MNIDVRQLLRHLAALGVFLLGLLPAALHLYLLTWLPDFHRFVREYLDPVWRYHIADSGVTVGLAYYAAVLFALWRTRWASYNAAFSTWHTFDDVIDKGTDEFFLSLGRRERPYLPEKCELQ